MIKKDGRRERFERQNLAGIAKSGEATGGDAKAEGIVEEIKPWSTKRRNASDHDGNSRNDHAPVEEAG